MTPMVTRHFIEEPVGEDLAREIPRSRPRVTFSSSFVSGCRRKEAVRLVGKACEESRARGARRSEGEAKRKREEERDGLLERANVRHAVPCENFLSRGPCAARVSSARVGGNGPSGAGEEGRGGRSPQGARRTAKASERVGRLTERAASVERAFIRASSCLHYAPLSELSSENQQWLPTSNSVR